MKITSKLAIATAIAALAACNNTEANNTDANMTDLNAGMTDMNAINATDGMNATENAMINDLTTNTADTNLANGM